METKLKKLISVAVILFITSQIYSSTLIRGKLVSSDLLRPIVGANIYNSIDLQNGTTSNQSGHFLLKLSSIPQEITISLIGYEKLQFQITDKNHDLGTIKLKPQTFDLAEIKIFASIAEERKTPVSVSTIRAETIEKKLGDHT